jgi:hypothetical protein
MPSEPYTTACIEPTALGGSTLSCSLAGIELLLILPR